MKICLLTTLLLLLSIPANAQTDTTLIPMTPKANIKAPPQLSPQTTAKTPIGDYVPFPQNFDTLDQAGKDAVSKTIDENTDKYFHSKEFAMALARFVEVANPKDIHECRQLSMDRAMNKITILEPLLWAKAADRHPMVGKWEQSASFTGCGKTYSFVIEGEAHKAGTPLLTVKP